MNFKKTLLVTDWYEYFRDDFDDAILRPEWLTYGTNSGRSIIESGGVCTLAITDGTEAAWWCTTRNEAPRMYFELEASLPCRVTTKLNLSTPTDPGWTQAGIMIARNPTGVAAAPADPMSHFWSRYLDSNGARDGIWATDQCGVNAGLDAAPWDTDGPVWLRVEISAAKLLTFSASLDGSVWTVLGFTTTYDYDPLYVGLVCANNTGPPHWVARSAPFEYFLIEEYKAQNPIEVECLAPIDTRAPTVFYEGRIKQMSSLKRAVDDKTGLFQIADMSMTLANEDKHYSQKMASRFLKNQEATLYHAWTEEAEALKTEIIKLIVEDHSMKGPDFIIKFKDITQKYFTLKVPANICTSDDFPDIHPDHEGRFMPEILGRAELSMAYEHPGAVEAVYVDTSGPPFRCLASAGLVTIPSGEVWIADVPKSEPVDYSVVQAGGRTYLDFAAGQDPGDDIVAFNAFGYSVPIWNSTNGYIQNLAYIMQYFLRFIMGIPHSLVNSPSFATLASYYEDMGVEKNGYLILQDRIDAMEVLRQLLFTGGAKGFMAMDGKFNVQRKNICNWEIASTDYHIFEQIELFGSPHRQWNLTSAINTVNVEYGLIPWQDLYTGARKEYKENRYGAPMEDDIRRERRERRLRI
jgi:hypothetical protein